jgi:serine protease Do
MRGQRPMRGYLGVSLQPVDEDLAPAIGIPKDTGELVRSVVPGAPGALAGLQQGDVIIKVGGQQVTPDQTVSYLVANTRVGSRVPLEIIRAGKHATVNVVVAERPTEEALAKLNGSDTTTKDDTPGAPVTPQRALGLSLAPLTSELARSASLPAGARGVLITSVDPNSNAAEKGLQRADLIVSVNNQPVTTPAQIVAAVDAARKAGRSSVLLLIQRGSTPAGFVGVDITGK